MKSPGTTAQSLQDRLAEVETGSKWPELSESVRDQIVSGLREEIDVYRNYKANGLYRNDGSTTPLWTMNWQYGPTYLISDDGNYLVAYNDWAESMDGIAIRFFDRGKLMREYPVKKLVDFPGVINFGSSDPASLDLAPWDIKDGQVAVKSQHGERFVFDVTTGEIVSSFRPPRWIIGGLVSVFLVLAVWRVLKYGPSRGQGASAA